MRKDQTSYSKNICIVEAMYKEAVFLGVFPPQDKLSGINIAIKIARAINSVSKTPKRIGLKLK